MPIQQCTKDGKQGWKWGEQGKCYVGPNAKSLAKKQGQAIRASGYTENQQRSPLKTDPTRTATLRRRFAQELRGRFNKLKGLIRELVDEEDVFGLKPSNRISNVENTRWRFQSSDRQQELFEQWMRTQINREVLATDSADRYWEEYVRQAYYKGQGRAFDDTMKGRNAANDNADFIAGTKDEFLRSSFNHPPSVEKVKLLAGRVFTDLKGITEVMGNQINRSLVDGMIQGDNPRVIASRMNKLIDGIGKRRATVLARTEIVRAHAEGQLDAFERLGVQDLGVAVEWSTALDERVCPLCQSLHGIVLKREEARGMIPRHPQCRCSFLPANVGEAPRGQKRSKRKIDKSIDQSIKAEIPPKSKRTVAQQRERTPWVGADKNISRERVKAIVSERKINKAMRVGKKGAQISNLGPELASETARQAGVSERVAKAALVVATLGDFALPGIPAGSAAVTLLAGAKNPKAVIRAAKAIIKRMKEG